MIDRTFKDIPKGQVEEADQQSYLVNLGWSRGSTWEGLLKSRRVLIISEAGSGKTYECFEQCRKLSDAGAPAFFIELASLAQNELASLLEPNDEERLEQWRNSQSEIATFFLDSIDELQLSVGTFRQALINLKKGIDNELGRARIIITSRPTPFDEQLVRAQLPIPEATLPEPSEESFAAIAMGENKRPSSTSKEDEVVEWRVVALLPLSDDQIKQFAGDQGIEEPDVLLNSLRQRNAQDFARRPQDLIELCADWRIHKKIRKHKEQVASNVEIKLRPNDNRREPADLSYEKAFEGASRLALAMQLTRRFTIRHSAASDDIKDQAALDPVRVLFDWGPNERKALLERPLFGFASYGRVRFHHRSVSEYLAAQRLAILHAKGLSFAALKRLIFTSGKNGLVVRPSKRMLAAWIALEIDRVFELLREHEPAVLLDEGDPESFAPIQKAQALRAYVSRYGKGGWRGMRVPYIQIHRFASPDLGSVVNELWASGIENPEVRQSLLYIIEMGRISDCSDIAFTYACDIQSNIAERGYSIEALVALEDHRLELIAKYLAGRERGWTGEIANLATIAMFPSNISVGQLCQILKTVKHDKWRANSVTYRLPNIIRSSKLGLSRLEELRDGLIELIVEGLVWRKQYPHIFSSCGHLSSCLIAACIEGLKHERSVEWFQASFIALRIRQRDDYGSAEEVTELHACLSSLNSSDNARCFWTADAFIQSLQQFDDPWDRLAELILGDRCIEIRADRDLGWILKSLSNTKLAVQDRAMLLEAAFRICPSDKQWTDYLAELKLLVADQPALIARIVKAMRPRKQSKKERQWEQNMARRRKQEERRKAKNKASWIQFWREVARNPDYAFAEERRFNTTWNLWRAMRKSDDDSEVSGWNRNFIEMQFGKETADKLRQNLMSIWRHELPTLRSERPAGKRNTWLTRWNMGLAAIYAEAEDPMWASKLTAEEVKLATRFTIIELNKLPVWVNDLVSIHPVEVDGILGEEIVWELGNDVESNGHSMLLQNIHHTEGAICILMLPRLMDWLVAAKVPDGDGETHRRHARRVEQVISFISKHGEDSYHAELLKQAQIVLADNPPQELLFVWVPVLMRYEPEQGVALLEGQLSEVTPENDELAINWFQALFGDHQLMINLKDSKFTPSLLLRLLKLAYQHIRPEDDRFNEGGEVDARFHAERARSSIINAIFDASGEDGWVAKLEMAKDPIYANFKDRILAVADDKWAQDMDSEVYDENEVVEIERKLDSPAVSNEAMFSLMMDRLGDINEHLLSDTSQWKNWASIREERVMRRAIAHELRHLANGLYTVTQENVTAEEKETDIRLCSTSSDHEAVIELKIADERSAGDLLNTIESQLFKKYMAPGSRRSGCLLFTLSRDKGWQHPDTNKKISFSSVLELLNEEAKRIENEMPGVKLGIHFLDLRPRLPKEKSES